MKALTLAASIVLAVDADAAAQGAAPPASVQGKRDACRNDVTAKQLRGPQRADAMQICMAEGRLACVKQAVAQQVPLPDRKAFLANCMSGPSQKPGDE